MKTINILIFLILSLLITACSEDPIPPRDYYNIDRIYSIDLNGSNRKLITEGSDFSLLSNNKIIYINDHKLFSCNSDGKDKVLITPNDFYVGQYRLFLNETKLLLNIYFSPCLINIDGSGFKSLSWAKDPVFNGIAISSNELYIINSDGSDRIRIKDTVNSSYRYDISFTADGNNIIYINDIQYGIALDLRLYNFKSKTDTSLFYSNGNIFYRASKWNTLLFANGGGINLENINSYKYTFIYPGGDPYFPYDSTKITFMNNGFTAVCLMDLTENSTKIINANLPNNFVSHPILSLD